MKGMKNVEKAADQRRELTKACRSHVHFVLLYVFSFDPKLQDSPKEEEEEEKTWYIILVYIPQLFVVRLPKNSPTPPFSLLHRSAHLNTATLRSIYL
jgi:hypothetical protein